MILRFLMLLFGAVLAYLLLSGTPAGLAPVLRSGLALLALSPVFLYWLWPKRLQVATAACRQPARWIDRLAILAVVATLASGFFWLLSAAPQPLESLALTVEQHLRPQAAAIRQAATNRNAPPREGNWLWDEHRRRPLPKRTHFKPGSRPEVFIRLHDPADAAELLQSQILVRAFALSRYDQAAWGLAPGSPETLRADPAGLIHLGNRSGHAIVHEVFHSHTDTGQNVLTALQGVVAVEIPQLTRLDEGLLLLPPPPDAAGYQYVASSAPQRLEDLPEGAEIPPWPQSPAVLTALPETGTFSRRLRELAAIAAGTGTTPQRLLNLRNHLRTTLHYSLETTNPNDLDPIENFLFAEQRGHCEFFATAGALLARALGVPARIAYGWTGGTYYENSRTFVFRAREAHAWTEVCLAGYGWVVMDPTPPVAIRGDQPRVARPDEKPPVGERPEDETPVETPLAAASPARIAWWLTGSLLVPALVLLGWRGLSHRRAAAGTPDGQKPMPGAPHYLSAWRRAAARHGVPMPAAMTLRRHLALLPQPPPAAAGLLEYHYAVRYAGAEPDPRREKQLSAAIRRWEDEAKPGGYPGAARH